MHIEATNPDRHRGFATFYAQLGETQRVPWPDHQARIQNRSSYAETASCSVPRTKGSLPYLLSCPRKGPSVDLDRPGRDTASATDDLAALPAVLRDLNQARRSTGATRDTHTHTHRAPVSSRTIPKAMAAKTEESTSAKTTRQRDHSVSPAPPNEIGASPAPFFLSLRDPCPSNGMPSRREITSEINTIRVIFTWWHYAGASATQSSSEWGSRYPHQGGSRGLHHGPPECSPAFWCCGARHVRCAAGPA